LILQIKYYFLLYIYIKWSKHADNAHFLAENAKLTADALRTHHAKVRDLLYVAQNPVANTPVAESVHSAESQEILKHKITKA
tara:strand:+ start:530 stop:775 length:246 start_codon:yes stop_codon:yes gene_type:complete